MYDKDIIDDTAAELNANDPPRDFHVENHGSIIIIRPLTAACRDWLADNISDDAQYFGDALCVEPRYAGALLYGMQEDGFESNVRVEYNG